MSRSLRFLALGFLAGASLMAGVLGVRGNQPALAAMDASTTLHWIEQNSSVTDLDLGPAGSGAGDLRVWGPNPLLEAETSAETGAMTQGTCIALNAAFDCLADETIVFADGSTLNVQGLQLGNNQASSRAIVGGTGAYLGATGLVSVAPVDNETYWTKTIEIVMPAA